MNRKQNRKCEIRSVSSMEKNPEYLRKDSIKTDGKTDEKTAGERQTEKARKKVEDPTPTFQVTSTVPPVQRVRKTKIFFPKSRAPNILTIKTNFSNSKRPQLQ